MMGAGKSTTGHLVAERLGWPYADSDEMVEHDTGRTVEELWDAGGEAGFRAEESRVLAEALQAPGPSVVSVAGGAVLDPANRRHIRHAGVVVWLRASIPTLTQRVGAGAGRPLLRADPPQVLAELDAVRRPYYAEMADAVIDVDALSPAAVAERVVDLVRPRADGGGGPS
jgi:shikimate kinase